MSKIAKLPYLLAAAETDEKLAMADGFRMSWKNENETQGLSCFGNKPNFSVVSPLK